MSRAALVALSLVGLLAACGENDLGGGGGSGGSGGGGGSGAPCGGDEACGPDEHCGAGGLCTADCTPSAGCSLTQLCLRGRCVEVSQPDMSGDGPVCASVNVDVTPLVPDVFLLIDQSGSMTAKFPDSTSSVNRWQAVKNALTDPTAGVVTRFDTRVRFGAALYTRGGAVNVPGCPRLIEAPIMASNRAAIEQLMTDNGPADGTPTGEAIDKLVAELKALGFPQAGTPTLIVLATDGLSESCANSNDSDMTRMMAERAASDAHAAGFPLFVLSVGDTLTGSVATNHLAAIARQGQGNDPNATPFSALTPAQLSNAFDVIIRGARSCAFTLNGTVDPSAAAMGQVVLNGTPLAHGTGWTLSADGKTIELIGADCQTFKNGDTATLSATFPCGTVIF